MLAPDVMIQRSIKKEESLAAATAHRDKLNRIAVNSDWFESKVKYDFTDGKKRDDKYMKVEISCANMELMKRRRARLQQLYDNDRLGHEKEFHLAGLAFQSKLY
eukprot:GEMP01053310.1.p1 GENE.GEMP01053310.1~~GEMP01053310.1.p1  ORF type:complete len:104 (+),score=26.84 GEMP01053310.1:130-441(+)